MTCAQAKEFLSRHNVPHVVRDIYEDLEAKAEFQTMGLEAVPVVVWRGQHVEIGHIGQLSELLGMPPEQMSDFRTLAAACDRVLQAWERLVEQLPDEHIRTPNPNPVSSKRTMQTMILNVFRWMEEETTTFDTGRFAYAALRDHPHARREEDPHDAHPARHDIDLQEGPRVLGGMDEFKSAREMLDYARRIRERWVARALLVTAEQAGGRLVTDDHGVMTQYQMLDAAARHAAGHLRQSYDFFRWIGIEPKRELTDAEMAPIAVQSRLY